MAGSVNKVILVGNLGQDPEVRQTNDGRPIVQLSVATSETWRDKVTGDRREKTEWHRVVIFNERLAEVARKFLSKGRRVYLEGQLQTRKWTDQQGMDRYTTEIVLGQFRGDLQILDSARGGEGGMGYEEARQADSGRPAASPSPAAVDGGVDDGLDDDIPC